MERGMKRYIFSQCFVLCVFFFFLKPVNSQPWSCWVKLVEPKWLVTMETAACTSCQSSSAKAPRWGGSTEGLFVCPQSSHPLPLLQMRGTSLTLDGSQICHRRPYLKNLKLVKWKVPAWINYFYVPRRSQKSVGKNKLKRGQFQRRCQSVVKLTGQ